MEGDTSQGPNIQKVQPEVKDVSQTPQQPPAGPQTPIERIKNFIKSPRVFAPILAYLILLGPTLYFYSGSPPEREVQVYKGAWCVFISPNLLAGLKDIVVNTVQIGSAADPFEFPVVKELVVANIQTAHRNGLKVFLTLSPSVSESPTKEKMSLETLNSRVIEYAKIAEKYGVEFFAPLNEPVFTEKYALEEIIDAETWAQMWTQSFLPKIKEFYPKFAERYPLDENIDAETWTQEILPEIKEVYPDFVATASKLEENIDAEKWAQDILPKVKEVYNGEVIWRGDVLYWSTDYSGYDYIGFTTSPIGVGLKGYPQYIDSVLDKALEIAEKDNCKGVMITESFMWEGEPGHSKEEVARALEIPFERGENKAVGFFPNFMEFAMSRKTIEVISRWYKEIL